jgi:choline dehydrogenase-like flavoprotein
VLRPSEACPNPGARNDDRAAEVSVREHTDTEHHPVGNCAMGPAGDRMAVLDAGLCTGPACRACAPSTRR